MRIIEWGKDHGHVVYDMGGTDPSDGAGVHTFKSGFGGKLTSNIHIERNAWHLPILQTGEEIRLCLLRKARATCSTRTDLSRLSS
jgi:hypothetical protein